MSKARKTRRCFNELQVGLVVGRKPSSVVTDKTPYGRFVFRCDCGAVGETGATKLESGRILVCAACGDRIAAYAKSRPVQAEVEQYWRGFRSGWPPRLLGAWYDMHPPGHP